MKCNGQRIRHIYHFTIEHSALEDGVYIAKHKKDVLRLAAMLTPTSRYELPETLRKDALGICCEHVGSPKDQKEKAGGKSSDGRM